MRRQRRLAAAIAVTTTLLAGGAARAGNYAYTDFPSLPDVKKFTVWAVNAKGQVVGSYVPAMRRALEDGFVWANGHYATLGNLGGRDPVVLFDINDSGLAVGTEGNSAITYDTTTGVARRIAFPAGATKPGLFRINNRGEMLGVYVDGRTGYNVPVFVSAAGVVAVVPRPPGGDQYDFGLDKLSDNGNAAGYGTGPGGNYDVVYINGRLKPLDPALQVQAIAPNGRLAGSIKVGDDYRSFVRAGSTLRVFDFRDQDGFANIFAVTSDALFASGQSGGFPAYYTRNRTGVFQFARPGASFTYVLAVNGDDTIAGEYRDAKGLRYFLGICAADQRPCAP